MNNPKISVIIPAYNHEKYIREAIYSVLRQTVTDFELIIINDGSTDGTEAVIQGIEDPRIRYFSQENQGAHNTINRGIELARGEFVSILNSDDAYAPERFAAIFDEFEANGDIAAVFTQAECIDGDGKFIRLVAGPEENWPGLKMPDALKQTDALAVHLLGGNFLMTTSNLFCRRMVFDEIGLFDNLRYAHDIDLFLKLCTRFAARFVKKPLLKYRMHATNTISENDAKTKAEVCLVLTRFFRDPLWKTIVPGDSDGERLALLLDALTPRDFFLPLTVPFLAGTFQENGFGCNVDELFLNDSNNPYSKACIDFFRRHTGQWAENQSAWQQYGEANERLAAALEDEKKWWTEAQKAWKEWETANAALVEKDEALTKAHQKIDELWRESQAAWKKWEETNDLLGEKEAELMAANGEITRLWGDSQKAWKAWEDNNRRIAERDANLAASMAREAELKGLLKEKERIIEEREAFIEQLLHSAAFRIGRAATWPVRALRNLAP